MPESSDNERGEARPGGVSVTLVYQAFNTPPDPTTYFLLMEDDSSLLLEDDSKLLLE